MPTAYQIKDQSTPHHLIFHVVWCLGLLLKTRHHQQLQRIEQQYTEGGNTTGKLWAGACEYITENGQQKTLTYLNGPEGVFALHVKNPNGSENIRYIHKDHLGSWNTITDENGNLLQELSFDAWGNRRNPATWRAFTGTPPEPLFDRGFTGHEHLYSFSLINMNGRMYDPLVSRMLSPDNFIQAPDFSQSFNRYSYAWNNPLVYTDPDGELAVFIGIFAGMYQGAMIAPNSQMSFGGAMATIVAGGIVGGLSGYVGVAIAASGIPFANTLGIAGASLTNSIGTHIYTGGQTDVSVSFGAASYNFTQGEWGYLGKSTNSTLENIGYGFGALANIQDAFAWTHGANITHRARRDIRGHSEIVDDYGSPGDIRISVGPGEASGYDMGGPLGWHKGYAKRSLGFNPAKGKNYSEPIIIDEYFQVYLHNVRGANSKGLSLYSSRLDAGNNLLNAGALKYGIGHGCVNQTARALSYAGVLNINTLLPITSPVFLHFELTIRQIGIYSSPYLINY